MPLDGQQKLLIELLTEAGDQPVRFEELHAAGIGFPASVISELLLAGYEIERVHHEHRLVGVRLLVANRSSPSRVAPNRGARMRRLWRSLRAKRRS